MWLMKWSLFCFHYKCDCFNWLIENEQTALACDPKSGKDSAPRCQTVTPTDDWLPLTSLALDDFFTQETSSWYCPEDETEKDWLYSFSYWPHVQWQSLDKNWLLKYCVQIAWLEEVIIKVPSLWTLPLWKLAMNSLYSHPLASKIITSKMFIFSSLEMRMWYWQMQIWLLIHWPWDG